MPKLKTVAHCKGLRCYSCDHYIGVGFESWFDFDCDISSTIDYSERTYRGFPETCELPEAKKVWREYKRRNNFN